MLRFDYALLSLALAASLVPACSDDDSSAEAGSGDSTGAATTSPPATTAPVPTASSGDDTGTDDTADAGSDTGTGTGTDTDSGGGTACGEQTCGEGEYCDWSANGCGAFEEDQGTCLPIPDVCSEVEQPVCGCDGVLYDNPCAASRQGVDVGGLDQCDAPEGTFACGYWFCALGSSYCQVSISDVGGYPDGYGCMSADQECASETLACECLTEEPCYEFGCEQSPEGGIEIVCPGG